jgi:hypothetical protein
LTSGGGGNGFPTGLRCLKCQSTQIRHVKLALMPSRLGPLSFQLFTPPPIKIKIRIFPIYLVDKEKRKIKLSPTTKKKLNSVRKSPVVFLQYFNHVLGTSCSLCSTSLLRHYPKRIRGVIDTLRYSLRLSTIYLSHYTLNIK